jgi:chromosome segregation protein
VTSPDRSPAEPRLLALRLQGFKSFAERTNVEFGPGISAVVGPNGSGKSNLADALRWALGEQGRALRSRRSEDVIWAGSDKRAAQGMADVTLVLDNADGLLPVDFQVLELGRRLYRSGENDYLLNKSRIRLRDLVDLLDAAHLADNAFLFIGQGMVDQALALRPEERRPLFEEVAGVRRHERRRRKAEEQLAESETNLARVEDILEELRPQARRLAAQAEQQTTRLSAGEELASALLAAAHVRWHEAARIAATTTGRVERERAEADRAMADLQTSEEAAAAIGAELGARAATERERLAAHEAARGAVSELRLREARLESDLEAIGRDRVRLRTERETAEASLATQRRGLAIPIPSRDHELDASLAGVERLLTEATGELASLRTASRARGEEAAAIRRAEAARQAEAETARRRLTEAVHAQGGRIFAQLGHAGSQTEADDLEPIAPSPVDNMMTGRSVAAASWRGVKTAFEFTEPESAKGHVIELLERGVAVVCGTTGWDAADRDVRDSISVAGLQGIGGRRRQ